MDNKKIAVIITIMILFIFIVSALIAISEHIPFIGKAFAFFFAIILAAGILLIVIYAARKGKK